MNILNAQEIQDLDRFTIENEPISSIDLMERAATICFDQINELFPESDVVVFAGTGNNGGDGLVVARLFNEIDANVRVYILGNPEKGSEEFKINLDRLYESEQVEIKILSEDERNLVIHDEEIVVDAIFGIGLNKIIEGWRTEIIEKINNYNNPVIAIDIPSGLLPDHIDIQEGPIIEANITLTFHCMKRALVFAENEIYCGEILIIDIGLLDDLHPVETNLELLTDYEIGSLLHWRSRFSHKGIFGHLMLAGGSYGKIGAMVLGARAALKSGIGLLTVHIPECGYNIVQTSVPEAMCQTDSEFRFLKNPHDFIHADALGIGPGMGANKDTHGFLKSTLENSLNPMVLDADALNIIAKDKSLIEILPFECILTPHPKEFDRLFGEHDSSFERIKTLQLKAIEHNIIIVLKGAYTRIAVPDGQVFINPTGNPGMATAGSGDVLTGIISSFLAQDYPPEDAAKIGVYVHGIAGDLAADEVGMTSLTATDIIDFLPDAILDLESASLY